MTLQRLFLWLCVLSASSAFSHTEQELDSVIEKWQQYPAYNHVVALASHEEIELGLAMAQRLVDFTFALVEWELDAQTKPLEEIEKSWRVSAGWLEFYRLHATFREALAACTTAECVNQRVKWQKRLFNWIERIGATATITERVGHLTKNAVNHIGQLFGLDKTPKFVVPPSLIASIYSEASAKIDGSQPPAHRDFEKLPIDKMRTAQKLILGQLARSGLSLDDAQAFIRPRPSKENKFTHEWRYSENVWLEAIRESRLAQLRGDTNEFLIPLRREFGGSHSLKCQPKGDIPHASHVGMVVGFTKWFCMSEQGGSYELTGKSTGLDFSIGLGVENAIVIRSVLPHLHWFTPEGYAAGIELGLIPFVGGRLSVALRPDLIRVYQAGVEFGQGITVSGMGLKLTQLASAHSL